MLKLCLTSLLLSAIPALCPAIESLNLNDAGTQQLLTGGAARNGYEADNNLSGIARESAAASNTGSYNKGMELNKDDNLFNSDGTFGVSKDTKMQINPNGVNFKLGY